MSHPLPLQFHATDLETLAAQQGRIAILIDTPSPATPAARRLDRAMRGSLARYLASDAFAKLKPGEAQDLAYPAGLACDALQVVKLPRKSDLAAARKAGGAIGDRKSVV